MTVAPDRRLRGWGPPSFWKVAPGTRATLETAEKKVVRDGHFEATYLKATLLVQYPSGEASRETVLLPRAGRSRAETMDQLAGGIAEAIGDKDRAAFKDELEQRWVNELADPERFSAAVDLARLGAPKLSLTRFLKVFDAAEAWWALDVAAASGRPFSAHEVRGMLEAAYHAGRIIREAEFPSDQARTRAARAARERADAAGAWQRDGAAWAQQLINAWPAGRKLSYAKLADEIAARWSDRPFRPAGPAAVDHGYLTRTHIPQWVAEGWLQFT